MKKVLYIFIFFIIFIACNELFQDISRQKMRESSYNKALQVSKIAKKHDILCAVDNTFMTPLLREQTELRNPKTPP